MHDPVAATGEAPLDRQHAVAGERVLQDHVERVRLALRLRDGGRGLRRFRREHLLQLVRADGDIELIQKTAERVVTVARSILNGSLPRRLGRERGPNVLRPADPIDDAAERSPIGVVVPGARALPDPTGGAMTPAASDCHLGPASRRLEVHPLWLSQIMPSAPSGCPVSPESDSASSRPVGLIATIPTRARSGRRWRIFLSLVRNT